jgi:hypothetical protein
MEAIFHTQVLSYVVKLEDVPTCITRVSNKVIPIVFPTCILPQPHFYPLNNTSRSYFNTLEYVSILKNFILKFLGMMAHERSLIPLVVLLKS